MDLSIVIPVYNEEQILERSLNEVLSFFSSENLTWELIVVNDGSTDGTEGMLDGLQERIHLLNIIHFDRNRGKGAAVREGFRQANGDYMLFFDIDLSTPLSTFDAFWPRREERTVLIGSRALSMSRVLTHQTKLKESTGKLGNLTTRALLPLPFHDTQCGFKLYAACFRSLLHLAVVNNAAFDIEWLLIAHVNGLAIEEMPVTWSNRPSTRFGLPSYLTAVYDLLTIMYRYRKGEYNF